MTSEPLTCCLYARISKTDANVPKVENQLADLAKLAAARGYVVVAEYVDDGLSAAKAENRPDFDRLLVDLADGKFAVILATEEARLARNEGEKFALMFACSQKGATWETMRDGAVDPSTAAGALMAGIRGSIDAFETRRKAERQRKANDHKREKGLPASGQRPFGFQDDRVTPEPAEAELIKEVTLMALNGATKAQLLRAFRNSGLLTARGNRWGAASVEAILKRWRNAGYTEHEREPYGHAVWEPIIADDRETALQMVRDVRTILTSSEPGDNTWKKPTYLVSGLAKCVCGTKLVTSGKESDRLYRCNEQTMAIRGQGAGHVAIRTRFVDPLVIDALLNLYLIKPQAQSVSGTDEATLAQLHKNLADGAGKLSRLTDLYADEAITKAEFQKKAAPIRIRQEELESAIAALVRESAHAAMLLDVRQMLTGAPGHQVSLKGAANDKAALRERFNALSLDDQRKLISSALDIVVLPGRGSNRVQITPR